MELHHPIMSKLWDLGGRTKRKKEYMKPPFNSRNSDNKSKECNVQKPNMCFRCGLEDHLIEFFRKQDTLDKKVHWSTENPKTPAYRSTKIDKIPENSTYQSDPQKIYAYMTRMSSNAEIPRIYSGDRLKLINTILDSGATCNMKL